MYSFKENLFPPPSLHFKTPYSRFNAKKLNPTVNKILNKQRTSENSYGRSLVPGKPPRTSQVLRSWEAPSTSYTVMDDISTTVSYSYSSRNLGEGEPGHFHPRKPHFGNVSFENSFDQSLELKMMSIDDAVEAESSKKSKSKTQDASPKGFQTKPRQNLLRLFTGSVENILQWSKLRNNHHVLFEVTASVIGVEQGKWQTEKIFYLSDSKSGPKLQVLYHEIDRPLPKIGINSLVTCVGRLVTRNRMQAYKIVESSQENKNDLQRVSFICNRVADELVAASQPKN